MGRGGAAGPAVVSDTLFIVGSCVRRCFRSNMRDLRCPVHRAGLLRNRPGLLRGYYGVVGRFCLVHRPCRRRPEVLRMVQRYQGLRRWALHVAPSPCAAARLDVSTAAARAARLRCRHVCAAWQCTARLAPAGGKSKAGCQQPVVRWQVLRSGEFPINI